MKKNFKRTLAAVMAAALTVTMAGMPSETDAAKKKPIKLSKSSVTVTKGKTKKVTIKNVKKKQVKKLKVTQTKKAKKIAAVTKSGKTALKVKGKKAGSAKATVSVTVKGKKKATKLKLTVKVKAAKKTPAGGTTQTQTPAGTATPGGTGTTPTPGGLNPGDTTPPSQGPGTQTDEPNKSERPGRTRPPATENPWPNYQAPSKRGKDMILKYTDEVKSSEAPHGGKLEEAGKIAFKDAAEGWTLGEGEKFDIMEYDRVVIKLNAKQKATMGAGDDGEQWSGKVGLSSTTNENLGATKDGFCTQYDGGPETKGRLVFLNDIDGTTKEMTGSSPREDAFKTEAYPDGYLVEYVIPGDIAKNDWWSPDDVSKYCDCINLQLANKGDYSNIYVEEIQLLSEKKATTDNLDISAGNATIKEGGSTKLTVSLKGVPDYAEITKASWSAEPAANAEISGEAVADSKKEAAADVKGIKAGDVTVTATVTVKIDGTVTEGLKVSKAIKVEKKDDTEPSSKPSTEPEPSTEPSSKPSTEPEPSTEPSAKPVTVVPEGALALTLGDMKEIVKGKEHAYATVSLAGEGTEDMKITAVEWSAVDSEKAECGDAEPEEDGKSCTTAVTGLKAGKTKIEAKVTVQEEGKAPSEPATVVSADEITVISEVTKEDLTIGISKSEIRLNETATVEVGFASTAADGAEITDIQWAVSETGYVETTDISTATTQEFIGKAETPDNKPVTIKATVTVAVGTKEFKDIEVTVPLGVVSVPIEATVETPTTEVVAGETVSVEVKVRTEGMGYADPENAVTGVTWSVEPESKASIETQNKERVIIKTKEAGEVKVTASVTVTDGETRTKDFWCTINVQPVFEPVVELEVTESAVNKGGEITLNLKNKSGEGTTVDEGVVWAFVETAATESARVEKADSDETKATLTALKAGVVTVKVSGTATKGKQKERPFVATKKITITDVALVLSAAKATIDRNEEVALSAAPSEGTIEGAVEWTVPENSGAEISEDGKLTAQTASTVKVTASAKVKVAEGMVVTASGETEVTVTDTYVMDAKDLKAAKFDANTSNLAITDGTIKDMPTAKYQFQTQALKDISKIKVKLEVTNATGGFSAEDFLIGLGGFGVEKAAMADTMDNDGYFVLDLSTMSDGNKERFVTNPANDWPSIGIIRAYINKASDAESGVYNATGDVAIKEIRLLKDGDVDQNYDITSAYSTPYTYKPCVNKWQNLMCVPIPEDIDMSKIENIKVKCTSTDGETSMQIFTNSQNTRLWEGKGFTSYANIGSDYIVIDRTKAKGGNDTVDGTWNDSKYVGISTNGVGFSGSIQIDEIIFTPKSN